MLPSSPTVALPTVQLAPSLLVSKNSLDCQPGGYSGRNHTQPIHHDAFRRSRSPRDARTSYDNDPGHTSCKFLFFTQLLSQTDVSCLDRRFSVSEFSVSQINPEPKSQVFRHMRRKKHQVVVNAESLFRRVTYETVKASKSYPRARTRC